MAVAFSEIGPYRHRKTSRGDALDLLASKQVPDGGWPAEACYYSVFGQIELDADWMDWDGTSRRKMNPWVTVDALAVLAKAGRLE